MQVHSHLVGRMLMADVCRVCRDRRVSEILINQLFAIILVVASLSGSKFQQVIMQRPELVLTDVICQ